MEIHYKRPFAQFVKKKTRIINTHMTKENENEHAIKR